MTKLGKFCLYTPMKVAALSLLLTYILLEILISKNDSYRWDYNNMGRISQIVLYLGSLLGSLASYTIALNLYACIRNNAILSSITFYLPIVVTLLTIDKIVPNGDILYFASCLPFLIPQTYYFMRFHKRLRSEEIIDDFYK